jgi:hypothetical protein
MKPIAHHHTPKTIVLGPRTVDAIAQEIDELLIKRKKTHDHFARLEFDIKLSKLLDLLVRFGSNQTLSLLASLAIALPLVLTALPARAQSAPCSPYMDARRCLTAIENDAKACVAQRFPNGATQEERMVCLDASLAANGAHSVFDEGDSEEGRP